MSVLCDMTDAFDVRDMYIGHMFRTIGWDCLSSTFTTTVGGGRHDSYSFDFFFFFFCFMFFFF